MMLLLFIFLNITFLSACPSGKYSNRRICISCEPGSYCPGYGRKYRCSSGSYAISGGRSYCHTCPAGYYCKSTRSLPKSCPPGKYQDKYGRTTCNKCPIGSYNLDSNATSCYWCPNGHYCPTTTASPKPCPPGEYQDRSGSTTCKQCPIGSYNLERNATDCYWCPKGHYCPTKTASPKPCPPGEYQDKYGSTTCKQCSIGSYNLERNATDCYWCPKGHYCPTKTASPKPCPPGEYQDRSGSTTCKQCSIGSYNLERNATDCYWCPRGHFCTCKMHPPMPCEPGTYQSHIGRTSCQVCQTGYYTTKLASTSCLSCPKGNLCPHIPTTNDIMSLLRKPKRKRRYLQSIKYLCTCPENYYCPSINVDPIAPDNYFDHNRLNFKSDMEFYSRMVQEAYDIYEGKLERGNKRWFTNKKYDINGFVTYERKKIIVAFVGSKSMTNFIQDVQAFPVLYPGCNLCSVHQGFYQNFKAVQKEVRTLVKEISLEHPGATVVVTGHSMGGAEAVFTAVDLTKQGYSTDLITFGSPRVGNGNFAQYVNSALKGDNLRISYKDDPVVKIPSIVAGYKHVGVGVHYTSKTMSVTIPEGTDYQQQMLSFFVNFHRDHKLENYVNIWKKD